RIQRLRRGGQQGAGGKHHSENGFFHVDNSAREEDARKIAGFRGSAVAREAEMLTLLKMNVRAIARGNDTDAPPPPGALSRLRASGDDPSINQCFPGSNGAGRKKSGSRSHGGTGNAVAAA